tara:strand:+ start:103 stop:324 length:222 start_codon:yes stop_codon:yes gene_type:complete
MEIMSCERFSHIIETNVLKYNTSYMDTIVNYCDENQMEIETAAKLVSGILKDKLYCEAQDLNYVSEKSAKLPL